MAEEDEAAAATAVVLGADGCSAVLLVRCLTDAGLKDVRAVQPADWTEADGDAGVVAVCSGVRQLPAAVAAALRQRVCSLKPTLLPTDLLPELMPDIGLCAVPCPLTGWQPAQTDPCCTSLQSGSVFTRAPACLRAVPAGWAASWYTADRSVVAGLERGPVICTQYCPALSGAVGRAVVGRLCGPRSAVARQPASDTPPHRVRAVAAAISSPEGAAAAEEAGCDAVVLTGMDADGLVAAVRSATTCCSIPVHVRCPEEIGVETLLGAGASTVAVAVGPSAPAPPPCAGVPADRLGVAFEIEHVQQDEQDGCERWQWAGGTVAVDAESLAAGAASLQQYSFALLTLAGCTTVSETALSLIVGQVADAIRSRVADVAMWIHVPGLAGAGAVAVALRLAAPRVVCQIDSVQDLNASFRAAGAVSAVPPPPPAHRRRLRQPVVPCVEVFRGAAVRVSPAVEQLDAGLDEVVARCAVLGEVQVVDVAAALGSERRADLQAVMQRHRVRVAGGVRTAQVASALLADGAAKVVIGSAASPQLLQALPRDRVCVAIDALLSQKGQGWVTATGRDVMAAVAEAAPLCCCVQVTFADRKLSGGVIDCSFVSRLSDLCLSHGSALAVSGESATVLNSMQVLDNLGVEVVLSHAAQSDDQWAGCVLSGLVNCSSGRLLPALVCDAVTGAVLESTAVEVGGLPALLTDGWGGMGVVGLELLPSRRAAILYVEAAQDCSSLPAVMHKALATACAPQPLGGTKEKGRAPKPRIVSKAEEFVSTATSAAADVDAVAAEAAELLLLVGGHTAAAGVPSSEVLRMLDCKLRCGAAPPKPQP